MPAVRAGGDSFAVLVCTSAAPEGVAVPFVDCRYLIGDLGEVAITEQPIPPASTYLLPIPFALTPGSRLPFSGTCSNSAGVSPVASGFLVVPEGPPPAPILIP